MTTMETEPQVKQDRRSDTQLLRDLASDVNQLLQQEIALAKTELSQKAKVYTRNISYLAMGGLTALMGLGLLFLAGVVGLFIALWRVMDWYHALWVSLLIIGGFVCLVGGIFAMKAMATLKKANLTPDQTVQTLQENKEWLLRKAKKTTAA